MVLRHINSNQREPRMKLHRKAKTTPASRAALVQRALAGEAYDTIAIGMGISVRTVAKWVHRFRHGDVAALEDGSSRPHHSPHQTPPGAIALIRQLRAQHGLPAW